MTNAEAIAHFEKRMHVLKDRYVDQFPRWTNADYVSVSLLLAKVRRADAAVPDLAPLNISD